MKIPRNIRIPFRHLIKQGEQKATKEKKATKKKRVPSGLPRGVFGRIRIITQDDIGKPKGD